MRDTKFIRFLSFLMTNEPQFRVSVLYYPLLLAAGSFAWLLLKSRSFSEALLFSAVMFLLSCFIGLTWQALRRRNLR